MKYLLLLLLATVVLLVLARRTTTPHFVSAHVINLDRSRDRLLEFQYAADVAGVDVQRWPAYDGRLVTEKDLYKLKIGKMIYRYTMAAQQPGVLGAFISHRSLLNHLRSIPCDGNDGHLIFEDDAYIPPYFWAEWEEIGKELPANWEIIQFGVTHPNIKKVRGRVHTHSRENGNVGMFAYAVRHRALGKICRHLEHMNDPIDNMIAAKGDEWKIYIIWPELCPHNDHGKSTIRD